MFTIKLMLDRILIILFVVFNLSGRFMPDKLYYICEAISFCIAAFYFINNSTRKTKIIAEWAFLLTINNLSDELFFNPCALGWNEVIIFVLATARAISQYMKQNGRNKR